MSPPLQSLNPADVLPPGFRIIRATREFVFDAEDRQYIDLFCGCGTVLLGHVDSTITEALHRQLDSVWITGAAPTDARVAAGEIVDSFFPGTHRLAGLYSTGMEAVEFAMRVARVSTGRKGVVSFEKCMHGKSTATAYLGWDNQHVDLPNFCRLPFPVPECADDVLQQLRELLVSKSVSAVFLEPLQGSSGGHSVSRQWLGEVSALCSETGSLLVIDEVFTGFHRTGDPFFHQTLEIQPDIVLAGKTMGNGFPVSAAVLRQDIAVTGPMLPGSTFSDNPLAATAVLATLQRMQKLPILEKMAEIEEIVVTTLGCLSDAGIPLRGKGALWVLEMPPAMSLTRVVKRIVQDGVLVSPTGSYLRLLPPVTIKKENLRSACEIIRDACLASV